MSSQEFSSGVAEDGRGRNGSARIREIFSRAIFSRAKCSLQVNVVVFSLQLYMYQLFRSLAYIHSLGICHRDIKPQNLLLDPNTGVLKLCDFGSAKHLVKGEPNVSYICSRYYRAPELIFGAIDYTTKIGKPDRVYRVAKSMR